MASLTSLQQNAVEWIALNDEPTCDDVETIAMQLTVVMAADLLGTTPDKLARRVLDYRDADAFERQLPVTKESPAGARRPLHLTMLSWRVIVALGDTAPEWAMCERLADEFRTRDGTMRDTLNALITRGLAESKTRRVAGTVIEYRLTKAGVDLVPEAKRAVAEANCYARA